MNTHKNTTRRQEEQKHDLLTNQNENPTHHAADYEEWSEATDSFDNMKLKENLLRGIYSYGFERPSQIQQLAIVPLSSGRDMLAQAQSGTGKTGSFVTGTLQQLDEKLKETQAIILAPTRELATQIHKVVLALGDFMNITAHACIGGTNVHEERRSITQNPPQVIIGTPGRTLDLLERGAIRANSIKTIVLDEADEMLKQGFLTQLYSMFQRLPANMQVALFSATMPQELRSLTHKFMSRPLFITVGAQLLSLDGIKQFYVYVDKDENKLDTLCDLYEDLNVTQSIVFCNKKLTVDLLAEQLTKRDFTVSAIHGSMEPHLRMEVMSNFRNGASRVLLATDVMARGIDVHHVSLVINYDVPEFDNNNHKYAREDSGASGRETYLHRIGRSGRYGRKGVAINFVTRRDIHIVHELEKYYSTSIPELPSKDLDSL